MKPKKERKLQLPVNGLSSQADAAKLEVALQTLPGVLNVIPDLGANQVSITYNPNAVDLVEFHCSITEIGFSIPLSVVTLQVQGMSCLSCVGHVKGALEGLPGVLEASVDLSQRRAQVTFVPAIVSPANMIQAVDTAGYQAISAQSP